MKKNKATTLEILLDLLAGNIPADPDDREIELPFEMFREEIPHKPITELPWMNSKKQCPSISSTM